MFRDHGAALLTGHSPTDILGLWRANTAVRATRPTPAAAP